MSEGRAAPPPRSPSRGPRRPSTASGGETPSPSESSGALEDLVYERVRAYVDQLQGHAPEDMWRLIMPQLERPLIRVALELSGGKRTAAAKMLGIHRNTLRTKLVELGFEPPKP